MIAAYGCGSEGTDQDPASEASTTAFGAELPPVPAGTELRVGDQLEYLQTYLQLAGEHQDLSYDLEYSAFDGGPPMLLAFRADAVDVGFIGTTPLIFAQAQGQDIQAVAAWATPRSAYSLVTAPGVDDISSWSDLRGRSVAYQRGTADEAALLSALDANGISPDDITTIDVPQTQVGAVLQGGSADAGVSYGPLTGVYLEANPTAIQADRATAITDRTAFMIASGSVLEDEGKTAALADYISRLVRSFAYLRAHPERIVQGLYVDHYGLSPATGEALLATTGVDSFLSLPGEIGEPQQRLADLLVAAGQIPATIDVTEAFDPRLNELVERVQDE